MNEILKFLLKFNDKNGSNEGTNSNYNIRMIDNENQKIFSTICSMLTHIYALMMLCN